MASFQKFDISLLKFFLSTTILMDAINGMVTMYFPGSLEQFVPMLRIGIILFFIYLLCRYSFNRFLNTFVLILSFVLVCVVRLLIVNSLSFSNLFIDMGYYLKLMNFFILFNVLIVFLINKYIDSDWILSVLRTNSIFMVLLIIVPTLMGISRATYAGSQIGSSGFFIANNSSNITLIISSITLLYLFKRKENLSNLTFFAFSLVALWMQGSKTSMVFIVIDIFVFLMTFFVMKKWTLNNILVIPLMGVIALSILIYFFYNYERISNIFLSNINNLVVRQNYLVTTSNSIFDAITSGRLSMLKTTFNYWNDQGNVFLKFFGLGISSLPQNVISEMDIIDIFIRTGIIGIFVSYIYCFVIFIGNYKNRDEPSHDFFAKASVIIMILYSIFAGHMFIEIMSSTFFTLVLCLYMASKEKSIESISSDPAVS